MYQIETFCLCGGWQNIWECNGELETFSTYQEAKDSLDDFLSDMEEAHFNGEIEDVYDRNDFRIVKL